MGGDFVNSIFNQEKFLEGVSGLLQFFCGALVSFTFHHGDILTQPIFN